MAPQFSGYPLKIVDPNNSAEQLPVVPTIDEGTTEHSTIKIANITDVPGEWDESWFANYE